MVVPGIVLEVMVSLVSRHSTVAPRAQTPSCAHTHAHTHNVSACMPGPRKSSTRMGSNEALTRTRTWIHTHAHRQARTHTHTRMHTQTSVERAPGQTWGSCVVVTAAVSLPSPFLPLHLPQPFSPLSPPGKAPGESDAHTRRWRPPQRSRTAGTGVWWQGPDSPFGGRCPCQQRACANVRACVCVRVRVCVDSAHTRS